MPRGFQWHSHRYYVTRSSFAMAWEYWRMVSTTDGVSVCGGKTMAASPECTPANSMCSSMPPITIPEASVTDVSGASGPTEIVVEGGLTLTVDPTTSTSPDFSNPTAIGGVDVAAEHWRVSEVEGAPVIKAWSLYPFGTHADEGTEFGIAIDDALGLAAGETVTIWGIQKDNGVLHHVADGTVNGDATAIDLSLVEGLHELAWVLVVD